MRLLISKPVLFYVFVVLLTSSFSSYGQDLDSSDIVLIKDRLIEYLSQNPPSPVEIQEMKQSMRPDGSWPGIDYYSIQVANWPAIGHLRDYVIPMAKAYANVNSPLYHDPSLAKSLHRSLGYWLDHNFTSRNWWYNDIGIPMDLTDILIMMDSEASLEEFLQATNQMRGSYVMQTGQNKVWRAEIRFKIGLIQYGRGRGNLLGPPVRKMGEMVEVLKSEVLVREKEGIQPDWSFHQHGVQQQFGNYGLSYATTQSKWAYILKGTPYQYSNEQIGILRNYILKGLSRVVWKGRMDISGLGRQIRPGNQAERTQILMDILQLMEKADPIHAEEYSAVVDFNTGDSSAEPTLLGNHYFWRSAMMTHRTDNYFFSIRMHSDKIQSTESGNGENLLAAHLSDGATYLYKSGKEYQNIFPVWDWHRIPGTTTPMNGALPEVGWRGLLNENDFVGGVSDGDHGVSAMVFQRDDLSAHKSWFFVPDGMICLGAGIHSSQGQTVATTLNQRLLAGPVTIGSNENEISLQLGQEKQGDDLEWVLHDGTGYVFFNSENVHVNAAESSGNWQRIYENGSPVTVRKGVFDLWVEHGRAPREGFYAYMVLPMIGHKDQLKAKAKHPGIEVLRNTSTIQAIYSSKTKLLQAVFYAQDQLAIDQSTSVGTNSPCIMMMEQKPSGMKVTLSVPPELPNDVVITLSGHYTGEDSSYDAQANTTIVKFDLPEGIYAGQSVTKTLQRSE